MAEAARRKWGLALAVFLCGFSLRPAVTSVSAVYGDIVTALKLTDAEIVVLTGSPVFLIGAAGFLGPMLARRFGAGRVLALGLALLALLLALRPYSGTPGLLAGSVLAYGLLGVMGVVLPAAIRDRVSGVPALHTAMMTLGIVSGAAAGSAVGALAGSIGWQTTLVGWAPPALAVALVWAALREAPRGIVPRRTGAQWRDAYAWMLTLFMGTQSALAFIVFVWVAPLLRDRGLGAEEAAKLVAISIGAQFLSGVLLPKVAGPPRFLGLWGAGLVGVTLVSLIGLLVGDGRFDLPYALALGLAQGGTLAVAFSMILADPGDTPVASLSAMAQGAGYLIAGFGPLAIGLLRAADSGLGPVLAVIGVFAGLSIAAALVAGTVLTGRLRAATGTVHSPAP